MMGFSGRDRDAEDCAELRGLTPSEIPREVCEDSATSSAHVREWRLPVDLPWEDLVSGAPGGGSTPLTSRWGKAHREVLPRRSSGRIHLEFCQICFTSILFKELHKYAWVLLFFKLRDSIIIVSSDTTFLVWEFGRLYIHGFLSLGVYTFVLVDCIRVGSF